jgi:hypothetical protein
MAHGLRRQVREVLSKDEVNFIPTCATENADSAEKGTMDTEIQTPTDIDEIEWQGPVSYSTRLSPAEVKEFIQTAGAGQHDQTEQMDIATTESSSNVARTTNKDATKEKMPPPITN